jgi:hypothetical protein
MPRWKRPIMPYLYQTPATESVQFYTTGAKPVSTRIGKNISFCALETSAMHGAFSPTYG